MPTDFGFLPSRVPVPERVGELADGGPVRAYVAATLALVGGAGVGRPRGETRRVQRRMGPGLAGAGLRPVRRISGRMHVDAPGDSCYLRSSAY